ncbi:MAG TPA: LamG-like jellyroll fold domain-containing protein [Pyrinomonadaceae bacterium]|nr:LamG-like jellyroll fold domain-containing protein [Pyrinomonadaceae bacterium]
MKQLAHRTLSLLFICAFALTFAAQSTKAQGTSSCAQPPRGQLHWLTGDGHARDVVENADGVLKNGTTFAPGHVAQAFQFDGVDDYVEVNFFPVPSPFNALTVEAWIKPTNVSAGRIADKAAPGGGQGFVLELSGGHLRASFGANVATSTASIPANTYTHAAATYDGAAIRLYVNGALDSTTTATTPGAISDSAQKLFFGAGHAPATSFAGEIDEIQFYTRSLTAADIQAIGGAGGAGKCKAGRVLISEFRLAGQQNLSEEFIEIYNNSDSEVVVNSTDGGAGWGVYEQGTGGSSRMLYVIPNGTRIPARGHYLAASTGARHATPDLSHAGQADATYTRDYCFGCAIILSSSGKGNISPDHRLDRVGFNDTSLFYREGPGIPVSMPRTGGAYDFSYIRKMTGGVPQDTNDNAADFVIVSNEPATTGGVFGAPGPQNLRSPLLRNKTIPAKPLDAGVSASAPPNRTLEATDTNGDGVNDAGVLKIRRTFRNLTKEPVTRLRFRVIDITTAPRADNTKADLRVINSRNEIVNVSAEAGGGTKVVSGVTLEDPEGQGARVEGGLNSSLVFTLAEPLPPGQSVDVNFWLRVVADGEFSFLVNVEAATAPVHTPRKRTARSKTNP